MLKFFTVMTALLLAAPSLAAPDPADSKVPPAPRGMMRYDTNKDGFVDRDEWKAGQEARFKQLDVDKDGKLSQDELFARTPSAPGNVLPSDAQVRRQTGYFRLLDSDKDGFVSKAEFMAGAERNFARCDLDKDGRINTAECRQALRRRPTEPASANR
jgi:Ca2+-binding EF-hand superfamily protein